MSESEPLRASSVLRMFGPMVYAPTTLFALGEGAIIPLFPVIAGDLGADIATTALIGSALVVGQLCGNLPAGWLVAHVGERFTMAGAGIVSLLGVVGIALAPTLWVLVVSVFLIGFCAAGFGLARHSFMTTRVPVEFRARALSLLGGTFRLGMFAGPFVAAGLLAIFGQPRAAVWFFGVCLVATVLLVLLGPDPEKSVPVVAGHASLVDEGPADTGQPITGSIPLRAGVFRTMWIFRGVLGRLGLAAASLSGLRAARQVVLPIWGVSIGLDASSIALVVGISGAIDFALFYASGQVMDRFGRLWAALPAMILMSAGFVGLSFTHDLSTAELWFGVVGIVLGVGNGLSSGILLTLGADVAPAADPAPFLGSWRTLTDAGGAVAPLLFTAVAAISTLSIATGFIGAIGLAGALAFVRFVPRYAPRRPQ